MIRQVTIAALAAASIAAGACTTPKADAAVRVAAASTADTTSSAAKIASELETVRRATARYRDIKVAEADGYVRVSECVANPGVGAMGVHYANPSLMGFTRRDGRVHAADAKFDLVHPEILVYTPQPDGSLALGAVEYVTSKEAWGSDVPPKLFGAPFNFMQDDPATPDVDEGHEFTPHYDLHVWLFVENPAGTLAQWNPAVKCPASMGTEKHEH